MKLFSVAVVSCVAFAQAAHFADLVKPRAELEFLQVQFMGLEQGASHYGNPAEGCEEDEVAVRIQGVKGAVCSPKCEESTNACPSDLPAGCAAKPSCLLQDAASGNKYCALQCSSGTTCGAGASCKILFPGIGLCTYD